MAIISVVAAALIVGSGSAAYGIPAGNGVVHADNEKITFTTKASTEQPIPYTKASGVLVQDPPGGGCEPSAQGTVIGTYSNGVLIGTESEWSAKVQCFPTAPGQSMGGISIESTLWLNGANIANGTPWNCVNCNLGNSQGAYICGGTGNCSGSYWVGGLVTLTLPAGWIWTGEPEHCILLSPQSLTCSYVSDPPAFVPPTRP